MMPNVAGPASTRRQIFAYALIVAAGRHRAFALGYVGELYGAAAAVLGTGFVRSPRRAFSRPRRPAMKAEKQLFGFSILYLFGIFAAYLADAVLQRALMPIGG